MLFDDRYLLGDALGVGGMGHVYAAQDRHSGRALAVKLLLPELASDPRMVARLREEARVARRVSHPNVARTLDDGVSADGLPYLVMERVPGQPLGDRVRHDGPLSLVRIRAIAGQILAGLGAIHAAGYIHGDVKSDNVLVATDGAAERATLIDFGLARPPATRPSLTGTDMVCGTAEYLAPEVVRGELATEASDLYAVGVVIYEMVTGTTPFAGGPPSVVLERHVADCVVPPSLRCPDREIPHVFEAILLRALDKDPRARHHDAASFATAIARSLRGAPNDEIAPHAAPTFSCDGATRDWVRGSHEACQTA
jgi:serine/threonine-protein kinase